MVLASIPPAARPHTIPLRTNPPVIYVSQKPAVLVVFDGKPSFAPIAGTALTMPSTRIGRSSTIRRPGCTTCTRAADGTLRPAQPDRLRRPSHRQASRRFPRRAALSYIRTALKAPKPAGTVVPHVIVSTVPSALIDIAGQPQFGSIPGTQLRYVSNTNSDVFFSRDTTIWYMLLSGRWFSAANLNGPWTFASAHLPADFKKIPEDSPRGRVLVSVPGTTQAFYAAAAAQVPHVVPVDPASATLHVTYRSGSPQFAPIATTPLQYAVNTADGRHQGRRCALFCARPRRLVSGVVAARTVVGRELRALRHLHDSGKLAAL